MDRARSCLRRYTFTTPQKWKDICVIPLWSTQACHVKTASVISALTQLSSTGQTFGAINTNTTFEYRALNNFAYKQESFTNCSIETSLRTLTVIGPPISWPSIGLGLTGKSTGARFVGETEWCYYCITVQCYTGAGLPAKFSTVDLLHWTRNSTEPSLYAYANSIWDQVRSSIEFEMSLI